MASEKLENMLNLAITVPEEERERSENLNVGYNPIERTWELIVKYHGDITPLADRAVGVEPLIAGYAILTVPESFIPVLAEIEEIEYIEKPKRLFFELLEGKQASCILPVTIREPFLTGKGVIVAVVDSGIDYFHEAFRKADGTTRLLALWDQTVQPDMKRGWNSPEGFSLGVEFSPEQINESILERERNPGSEEALALSRDITGHGTAVANIAAGNEGVASESPILAVKLGNPRPDSFPRTTELMRAMTYVVQKALRLGMPVSVNISFGNTYGPHDGTSLLERFMDNVSEIGRCVICAGSGNEGAAMGHAMGNALTETATELSVGNYERSLSVQLWLNPVDSYRLSLISPGGITETVETGKDRRALFTQMPSEPGELEQSVPGPGVFAPGERNRARRFVMEGTVLLLYIGQPSPYSVHQEIYMEFLPEDRYITPGIWTFILEPVRTVTGNYSFYLPSQAAIGANTRFFQPSPEVTLTIPSTAAKLITVGAYDVRYDAYADFSGRGYLYADNEVERLGIRQVKPDIVAPGVNIMTAMSGGGYGPRTGTSFAAPFVTGSAALMMEWGIVRGNDFYLYGEKVKAYLRRGARPLRGETVLPDEKVGYGALCLRDSLFT